MAATWSNADDDEDEDEDAAGAHSGRIIPDRRWDDRIVVWRGVT